MIHEFVLISQLKIYHTLHNLITKYHRENYLKKVRRQNDALYKKLLFGSLLCMLCYVNVVFSKHKTNTL